MERWCLDLKIEAKLRLNSISQSAIDIARRRSIPFFLALYTWIDSKLVPTICSASHFDAPFLLEMDTIPENEAHLQKEDRELPYVTEVNANDVM